MVTEDEPPLASLVREMLGFAQLTLPKDKTEAACKSIGTGMAEPGVVGCFAGPSAPGSHLCLPSRNCCPCDRWHTALRAAKARCLTEGRRLRGRRGGGLCRCLADDQALATCWQLHAGGAHSPKLGMSNLSGQAGPTWSSWSNLVRLVQLVKLGGTQVACGGHAELFWATFATTAALRAIWSLRAAKVIDEYQTTRRLTGQNNPANSFLHHVAEVCTS